MYQFNRFSKWGLPIYELPINQISDYAIMFYIESI